MEKEKKEIKISLWTFCVLVAAVVVLVGAVIIGELNTVRQENNKQNGEGLGGQQVADNDRVEQLNVNSELVQELYEYLFEEGTLGGYPYAPNWARFYFSVYNDEKITRDMIINEEKFVIALGNLGYAERWSSREPDAILDNGMGESYYFDKNEIAMKIKKIFGVNDSDIEKIFSSRWIENAFKNENGKYVFTIYEDGDGYGDFFTHQIKSAEKNGEYIYIYDYCIYSYGYDNNFVCADGNGNIVLNKKYDQVTMWNKNTSKYEFITTNNVLPTYKHSFKIDNNGEYHWESSELINKSKLLEDNAKEAVLRHGDYTVDEVKADEAGVTNEECGVTLITDKEFYIYEGWGSGYSGIYEIKDNKLTCKANLHEWDGGAGPGSKKVDIIFTFDIIRNNKLKLVNIENKNEHNIYKEGLTIDMTYSIK